MHGKWRKNEEIKKVNQRGHDSAYKEVCLENAHNHFLASLAFRDMACPMKVDKPLYTLIFGRVSDGHWYCNLASTHCDLKFITLIILSASVCGKLVKWN